MSITGTAAIDSSGPLPVASATGGSAEISAAQLYTNTSTGTGALQGNVNVGGNGAVPTGTGVSTADPFVGINPPVTGLYGATITGTSYQGYAVNPAPIGSVYQPGIYTGTLSVPNGTTTFASGVYILMNGMSLTGNQTVNSATTGGVDGKGGVLFYVYRGSVSLAGNGGATLSPFADAPSSYTGAPSPWPGIVIWQDGKNGQGTGDPGDA